MTNGTKNGWLPAPVIGVLILVMVFVEAVFIASDNQWITARGLRSEAYQYAGFWPGLLDDWKANYDSQPYVMFGTYAFLHGGLSHLLVNMITLWSLGHAAIARVGTVWFVVLYIASIIGGAVGYALLWSTPQPMVGASGALFGLAGAWLAWEYVDRFSANRGLWPVARIAVLLLLMNVVFYYSLDGQLAWQTHLGGFIAGWIMANLIDPRARTIPEEEA